MNKQILITSLVIMSFCMMGMVLADTGRVKGDVNLVWNNYGSYPQDLSGSISGDLSGSINVVSN